MSEVYVLGFCCDSECSELQDTSALCLLCLFICYSSSLSPRYYHRQGTWYCYRGIVRPFQYLTLSPRYCEVFSVLDTVTEVLWGLLSTWQCHRGTEVLWGLFSTWHRHRGTVRCSQYLTLSPRYCEVYSVLDTVTEVPWGLLSTWHRHQGTVRSTQYLTLSPRYCEVYSVLDTVTEVLWGLLSTWHRHQGTVRSSQYLTLSPRYCEVFSVLDTLTEVLLGLLSTWHSHRGTVRSTQYLTLSPRYCEVYSVLDTVIEVLWGLLSTWHSHRGTVRSTQYLTPSSRYCEVFSELDTVVLSSCILAFIQWFVIHLIYSCVVESWGNSDRCEQKTEVQVAACCTGHCGMWVSCLTSTHCVHNSAAGWIAMALSHHC